MFNWIDIVIAIIVLYNVVRGFSLGFIRSVIGMIGYILAFWISKEYHNTVATYLLENFKGVAQMKTNLIASIDQMLSKSLAEGTASMTGATLEGSGIPFLEKLNVNDFVNVNSSAATTIHDVATKISDFIISGIAAILVFLTVLLIIKIIGSVLNAVMELPILKGVNRFAGLLIGLIKGGLFIFVVMTLLAFLSPAIHDTVVMQALYQSKVGIVFYNNNIILALINMYLLG